VKSELEKSGIQLLKTLGHHADLIMEIYLKKEIPSNCDERDLDKLIKQRILWRPNSYEELHLTKAIRDLLEHALQDERNRQIDSSIGDQLAVIKTLITHYKEACTQNRYLDSEEHLKEIGERVFAMMSSLHNNLRLLWTRINNEFALVATLAAKIRENELAQQQVNVILACLEMLNFAELSELAGNDRDLRHLLVVSLQREAESCLQELKEIQQRLLSMLGRFKQIQHRSKVIRGFDLFLDQHPDYVPNCYPEHPKLSPLFNQIATINIRAVADVTVQAHEGIFVDLIQSLAIADSTNQNSDRKAQAIEMTDTPEETLKPSFENQALEEFFCYVVEHPGEKISARNYYQQIDFMWDMEFWLFGVLGYFEGLSQFNKENVKCELTTQTHPVFSGNRLIEDIELWMN
jgi:hypothetical protein